jgi:hypothetical protein
MKALCPGVRYAHPGLYATVHFADLLSVLSKKGIIKTMVPARRV